MVNPGIPPCVSLRCVQWCMPPCVSLRGVQWCICLPMCLPGWVQGVSLPICLSFTRFTVGLEVAARALIPGNKPLRTVTFLAKRSRKGALLTVLARMRGLGGPERAFSSRFTVGFHLFPHELLLFLTVLTRNDGKRRPRVGVLRTSGMSECCKCALFLLLF